MAMNLKNSVLLIVDVQNDFLPGGALAVDNGDEIISVINKLQEEFNFIVATQDFHPAEHGSFAANHEGKNVYDEIKLHGLSQTLWPVHCVQGSNGAEFPEDLSPIKWKSIFQKGKNPDVDSYSGFFDNARREDTGLGTFLQNEGIMNVFVTGLAQDYCVKYTALDAVSLGFKTYLLMDATKAVNIKPEDGDKALEEMKSGGVILIDSTAILD